MSWATTFWNLEYIVDAARRAMEAAYFAELEAAGTVESALDPPIDNAFEQSSLGCNVSGGDALKMMESALTSNTSADRAVGDDALENLAVSMRKESLTTKQPMQPQASTKPSSPWNPEIEAALRVLLRPLSINLRYEYRFSDMLDEKTSIETMNSLFKQRSKPDDVETRNVSAREEIRRKLKNELRRSGTFDTNARKLDHKTMK